MKRIQNFYELIFCLYIFFIVFEKHLRIVPNILLGVILFSFVVIYRKPKLILVKTHVYVLLFLSIFILFHGLFISRESKDLSFFVNTVSIPMILILATPIKKIYRLKVSFILSSAICIILSFYQLLIFYIEHEKFNFSNGEQINNILLIERLYFGFVCVISIVFSYQLFYRVQKKYNQILLIVNIIVCSIFVFIISARMAILSLILLVALKIILVEKKSFKIKFKFVFVMFLFLSIALSLNENLRNRLFQANRKENFIESIKIWEPRVAIWDCSYKLIGSQEYKNLFGLGKTKADKDLIKCYRENIENKSKKEWFIKQRFNSHNQFIGMNLSYGLIGLFIFLLFFIIAFKNASKESKVLLLVLVLFLFVENILHRQIGVYLFALILVMSNNPSQLKEIRNGHS